MKKSVLYVLVVLVLATSPFWMRLMDMGKGTDNKAVDIISSINPQYKPWIGVVGLEVSDKMEPYMFAIQIVVGMMLFGGFYYLLRRSERS